MRERVAREGGEGEREGALEAAYRGQRGGRGGGGRDV